jgi:TPP-dependent pyruvate/acetoin dehydrogenase alpha subunit
MATGEVPVAGEHAQWLRDHDPLLRMARTIAADARALTRLDAIDRDVRARIDAAVAFALQSPLPENETACEHVFV